MTCTWHVHVFTATGPLIETFQVIMLHLHCCDQRKSVIKLNARTNASCHKLNTAARICRFSLRNAKRNANSLINSLSVVYCVHTYRHITCAPQQLQHLSVCDLTMHVCWWWLVRLPVWASGPGVGAVRIDSITNICKLNLPDRDEMGTTFSCVFTSTHTSIHRHTILRHMSMCTS